MVYRLQGFSAFPIDFFPRHRADEIPGEDVLAAIKRDGCVAVEIVGVSSRICVEVGSAAGILHGERALVDVVHKIRVFFILTGDQHQFKGMGSGGERPDIRVSVRIEVFGLSRVQVDGAVVVVVDEDGYIVSTGEHLSVIACREAQIKGKEHLCRWPCSLR